ncbi:MAG: hypothetical protein ACE5KA_09215 [Nitrososphaerales archaeon]
MSDTLQPIRIPTELQNYVLQICERFLLPDMIWRAAFYAIRKHGKNPYYSDKDYKAVAGGLVSVVVEVGIQYGFCDCSRIKNIDLADYLHLNRATIVKHRNHWKHIIEKFGKHVDERK